MVGLAFGALLVVVVQSSSDVAKAPVATPPVKEKRVCRTVNHTGSFIGERVCMTQREWTAIHDANQRNTDNALSHRGARR